MGFAMCSIEVFKFLCESVCKVMKSIVRAFIATINHQQDSIEAENMPLLIFPLGVQIGSKEAPRGRCL